MSKFLILPFIFFSIKAVGIEVVCEYIADAYGTEQAEAACGTDSPVQVCDDQVPPLPPGGKLCPGATIPKPQPPKPPTQEPPSKPQPPSQPPSKPNPQPPTKPQPPTTEPPSSGGGDPDPGEPPTPVNNPCGCAMADGKGGWKPCRKQECISPKRRDERGYCRSTKHNDPTIKVNYCSYSSDCQMSQHTAQIFWPTTGNPCDGLSKDECAGEKFYEGRYKEAISCEVCYYPSRDYSRKDCEAYKWEKSCNEKEETKTVKASVVCAWETVVLEPGREAQDGIEVGNDTCGCEREEPGNPNSPCKMIVDPMTGVETVSCFGTCPYRRLDAKKDCKPAETVGTDPKTMCVDKNLIKEPPPPPVAQ